MVIISSFTVPLLRLALSVECSVCTFLMSVIFFFLRGRECSVYIFVVFGGVHVCKVIQ